ncbi:hypothetical protein [Methanogenium cariaci]|nr:hypothetical protein [Methanogenium cariaci]
MVVGGIPWWLAAFSIMLFDLMGALFIIWNFPPWHSGYRGSDTGQSGS